MKKKRIIPLVMLILSVLLIMGSANVFILKTRENEKKESTNDITEVNKISDVESKDNTETINTSEEPEMEINEEKQSEKNNNSETVKENNSQTSNDSNIVKEQVETKSNENEEVNKNNSQNVDKEENSNNSSNNNVPSKNAWDELGITEYDYYNSPMWSWARIDFSIEEFKSYEETRNACIAKGEEYFAQGYGYSCTGINSYSGKYLGEMLKTF